MGRFRKVVLAVVGGAYLGATFQGFSHSKETPVKATVPAIANMVLSTNTGDGVIIQMQVAPGQALPEKTQSVFLAQQMLYYAGAGIQ